jgi:hypothetical protein
MIDNHCCCCCRHTKGEERRGEKKKKVDAEINRDPVEDEAENLVIELRTWTHKK